MGEFFDDITRDLREIRRAAEEAVVPLREIDAATSSNFGTNGGPAINGSIRGGGVFGSGRSSVNTTGGGGKFKDVREAGNIVQDLVSGNYGGAITSITKEVAKKFKLRSGIAAGGAIFVATSAVSTAFERGKDTNTSENVSDVAQSLRPLQDLGGRRASAANAEGLIKRDINSQIEKLSRLDKRINRGVGQEGVFREIAETGASLLNKVSFGIIPSITTRKELREKAAANIEKEAGKVAAAVAAGYEQIGLGNLLAGSNALKEANKFDPNIGKMWYSPGTLYMGAEAARIAGVNFAASKMKRANQRIGD